MIDFQETPRGVFLLDLKIIIDLVDMQIKI